MLRPTGMLLAVAAVVATAFLCPPSVDAKRTAPKEVKPVIHSGIKYTAPHDKMGYVVAVDEKTGDKLWEKKIYDVKIDPALEADVQWVFITSLSIKKGKLIVVNEKGKKFEVDLDRKSAE